MNICPTTAWTSIFLISNWSKVDLNLPDQTRGRLLDWPQRFQIICGIARGLLYLHQDSRLRIILEDFKGSNVLLDKEMNTKISDFGMARTFGGDQTEGVTRKVVGTYGYMAPDYAIDGKFSVKSDVYSFGIIFLETLSGRISRGCYDPVDNLNLIGHAWKLWKEGRSNAFGTHALYQKSCFAYMLAFYVCKSVLRIDRTCQL